MAYQSVLIFWAELLMMQDFLMSLKRPIHARNICAGTIIKSRRLYMNTDKNHYANSMITVIILPC